MRPLLIIAAIAGLAAASAASATEPPNARAMYVERRGLIEADVQCRLFNDEMQRALMAGAAQARGALLRAGWSNAQVAELEQAVVLAARARTCSDRRTLAAAEQAREAFATWLHASSMNFPGWDRAWLARRVAGANGWPLSQEINAPLRATFGVRTRNGAQQFALVVPLARGEPPPSSARLIMRDAARASMREISLTQRMAYGIEAGAPAPDARASAPSSRVLERTPRGANQAVFIFPDAAFGRMATLDPRETVEISISTRRGEQRLFVEVGDMAAARAFLTMAGS